MLGPRAEERRQRIARFRRPGADPFDEKQLAIAAGDPVCPGAGRDDVALRGGKGRERPDLLPLPETIACGEAPGGGDEIVRAEWELANRRIAQESQLRRRCTRLAPRQIDLHLRGQRSGNVGQTTAERIAETLQFL